ncbi:unnamed protein product [Urochloa decumbens]|uniref:Sister chromatid cohesion 1 protein 3 n=1 Tax=Urochloa decumbens TaxID=240449 RepID=A0ABC9BAI0_9POAL
MFYSHTILARKSPLGTVWIAAHLERKIKKPQIDGIDIPSYAESIMFPEVPIALRLSGHLLLGLVRIYSWKVNYLFQDCNRMVSTIRTAFASVQVDLPVDADRAPFESITLPPTLNLDDLNLDDAICLMETPDSHQKTRDQITLSEGEYVMIELDEDARVEPSAPGASLHMEPAPIEDETFPPFHDDFGADNNRNEEIPIDSPPGNLPVNSNVVNQTDAALDPPETMREAPLESPGLMLTESILGNNDPMDLDNDRSPFVQNKVISPPVIDETSSAGRQAPGRSILNLQTPNTYDAFVDDAPLNFDTQLPEFQLEPSPPPVQENEDNRRPKAQANKRKRMRMVKFDLEIVLSNGYMRKQIDGAGLDKLICKRRKLPQTALDTWRFSRTNRKGSFLLEPVLHGMCANLHENYERNFPRVSGSDAECEPAAGVTNDGLDAAPEQQGSPHFPGTADLLPENQLSPNSLGNADAQPGPLPSPKSPGAGGAAPDDDMLPELPRFSPMAMSSPIRGNDTPYKTPGGTPPSWLGGTGVSEIPSSGGNGTGVSEMPSSGGNYSLPGQSTRGSDHMPFLFPINEDDDDQPEIPGLMSTPGGVSSVGTRTTGLGSMSTRTRAVARFFKDHVPSSPSDEQPGKFSLNKILEGKARKQAARMFFETTVLKSYDYIDVRQEEPYGDIEISVKPSLSTAKF